MAEEKAIFIIPGYRQRPTQKAYRQLAQILKAEGYHPILVSIPWANTTISQNAEFFLKKLSRSKATEKYILGFSYGAMIALVASTRVKTDGLILCSLSPYFSEDLTTKKTPKTKLMQKRYEDFTKMQCSELSSKVKTNKVLLLYGQEEAAVLVNRVKTAFGQVKTKKKYLIKVAGAEHEIGNKNYLSTIHFASKTIL
ncbi:MAG: hypothetical protein ACM3IJ_03870 [Candidatus Levyibacteriota bacterium]